MAAIVFGLLCACSLAFAIAASSRSVLVVKPFVVVAWVMVIGFTVMLPLAVFAGMPKDLSVSRWLLLIFVGVGNVGGLMLMYWALKYGKVAIVAPIVAAEGAIAALLSILTGEVLGSFSVLALVLVVCGVVTASVQRNDPQTLREPVWKPTALAIGASVLFGTSLFATGFLAGDAPSTLLLLSPRLIGVVLLALPFALQGKMRVPKRVAPLLLIAGVGEVLGIFFFILSAQDSIAIASVLLSQNSLIAAIIGVVLFRERLTRSQYVGVAALLVGVTLLAVSANV